MLFRVVSSAYIMKLNMLLASEKSFIYIIHSNGPRIEPFGTPVVIGKMLDFMLFIIVC